jgi:hypothetical protein
MAKFIGDVKAPAALFDVDMVRGLFKAAEYLELLENGKIRDSAVSEALGYARKIGLKSSPSGEDAQSDYQSDGSNEQGVSTDETSEPARPKTHTKFSKNRKSLSDRLKAHESDMADLAKKYSGAKLDDAARESVIIDTLDSLAKDVAKAGGRAREVSEFEVQALLLNCAYTALKRGQNDDAVALIGAYRDLRNG